MSTQWFADGHNRKKCEEKTKICFTSAQLGPNLKTVERFLASMSQGHYMTPTQTMHYYKENPSKIPYICIKFDSPKMDLI